MAWLLAWKLSRRSRPLNVLDALFPATVFKLAKPRVNKSRLKAAADAIRRRARHPRKRPIREVAPLAAATEAHFHQTFHLNVKGLFFTV